MQKPQRGVVVTRAPGAKTHVAHLAHVALALRGGKRQLSGSHGHDWKLAVNLRKMYLLEWDLWIINLEIL